MCLLGHMTQSVRSKSRFERVNPIPSHAGTKQLGSYRTVSCTMRLKRRSLGCTPIPIGEMSSGASPWVLQADQRECPNLRSAFEVPRRACSLGRRAIHVAMYMPSGGNYGTRISSRHTKLPHACRNGEQDTETMRANPHNCKASIREKRNTPRSSIHHHYSYVDKRG